MIGGGVVLLLNGSNVLSNELFIEIQLVSWCFRSEELTVGEK